MISYTVKMVGLFLPPHPHFTPKSDRCNLSCSLFITAYNNNNNNLYSLLKNMYIKHIDI